MLTVARHVDATVMGSRTGNIYLETNPVCFFVHQCCVPSNSSGFEQCQTYGLVGPKLRFSIVISKQGHRPAAIFP